MIKQAICHELGAKNLLDIGDYEKPAMTAGLGVHAPRITSVRLLLSASVEFERDRFLRGGGL